MIKMLLKRITCAALALLMCIASLLCASCSITEDNSPAVLKLDGHKVTAAMYNYWAALNKAQYLYKYTDVKDTPEFWASALNEEETTAEYFDRITLDTVKASLIASKLFDDYGLSFTEKEKQGVKDFISDLIKEYANSNRSAMNTVLKEYGIDLNILEKIYMEEEKPAKIYDYLYGEGGKTPMTDEDYEKFYKENYVHFQMIYVNNMFEYETDEDGNRVTDYDGYYITKELNEKDKAEKDAIIKTVTDSLEAGGDYDELYEKYSERKDYSGGYYYSAAESYGDTLYYQLIVEAQKLEVGEWTAVEVSSGTCIIKKLELDEGAWKKKTNEDFFGEKAELLIELVKDTAYRELIESYMDKVWVDEEAIKEFSVSKVTPCYSF